MSTKSSHSSGSSSSSSKPTSKPKRNHVPKPEWNSAIGDAPQAAKPPLRKPMPYKQQMQQKKRKDQEEQELLDNWLVNLRSKGGPEPVWESTLPEPEPKNVRNVRRSMNRMSKPSTKSTDDDANQWIGGLRDTVHSEKEKEFVVDIPEKLPSTAKKVASKGRRNLEKYKKEKDEEEVEQWKANLRPELHSRPMRQT